MSVALLAITVLWVSLIIYALLGGADFGAGAWDLLARGNHAKRQHGLINHALGPVWEANHVWIIFLIVGLFNVFPTAFAVLSTALFVPLTLALLGIVLRGSAFIFRYYAVDQNKPSVNIWNRVFSVSSLLTPFFLGAAAAAVASGRIQAPSGQAEYAPLLTWFSPFAIVIGTMAVALCTTLAGIYLTVEANNAKDQDLTAYYRLGSLISGAVTSILGAVGLGISPIYAPLLWQGMLGKAIPVVIATMIIGLGSAAALFFKRYRIARVLVALETAFLLGSWGLSQVPYIIPPHITIDNSANDPVLIISFLVATGIGALVLFPSLYYLFSVFKLPYPVPGLVKKPDRGYRGDTRISPGPSRPLEISVGFSSSG